MTSTAPIRLIVNADDFGMTAGVNRAVAEVHAAGGLTSATLMACGAAFADAVRIARERPTLGIGCHVVLVDGIPASPSSVSLVGPDGALTSSMATFAARVQAGKTDLAHIQAEVEAQIGKLQDAGIQVTHVDTHKHAHLLPRVARAVMRGARRQGVQRIRNPFEPAWCSRISPAPAARRIPFRLLHQLRRHFLRLLEEEGMRSTDASLGLIATGSLDRSVLQRILDAAPPGSYEVVCHPGYNDGDLQQIRTKLRDSREVERDALLSVIPGLAEDRFERISFAGLAGRSTCAVTEGA